MPAHDETPGGEELSPRWVLYHLERVVQEHQRAHDQRHASDQEALMQARRGMETQMEKLRLELLREMEVLRGDFNRDRGVFLSREEYETEQAVLAADRRARDERITALESSMTTEAAVDALRESVKTANSRFWWTLLATILGAATIVVMLMNGRGG